MKLAILALALSTARLAGAQDSPWVSNFTPAAIGAKIASPMPASYFNWVVTPVLFNIAGNGFDALSSWKQPEANRLLGEASGKYKGYFYRGAVTKKVIVVGSVSAISLAVGAKWPRTRRFIGILNGAYGVTFTGIAISNVVRNPYYR